MLRNKNDGIHSILSYYTSYYSWALRHHSRTSQKRNSKNFKETDLPRIEKKMREISARAYPITGKQVDKETARQFFKDNKFKLELIDSIESDTISIHYIDPSR